MLNFFSPSLYKPTMRSKSVLDIPFQWFYDNDIKLIIVDLDDTLAGRYHSNMREAQARWVRTVKHHSTVLLISNNPDNKRVAHFARRLQVEYLHNSGKPFITDELKTMISHYSKEKICVIGDQLVTDVALGNNIGCKSIYIAPLTPPRLVSLFFLRIIEKGICKVIGV